MGDTMIIENLVKFIVPHLINSNFQAPVTSANHYLFPAGIWDASKTWDASKKWGAILNVI